MLEGSGDGRALGSRLGCVDGTRLGTVDGTCDVNDDGGKEGLSLIHI